MQLYFARHGQTLSSSTRRLTNEDEGLTAAGKASAEQAAKSLQKYLNGKHLSLIITSPRRRTMETAHIIARTFEYSVPIEQDRRLVERDCTDYDGQLVAEVFSRTEQELIAGGMEPFEDLYARTKSLYDALGEHGGDDAILLVGHSGNLKPLTLAARNKPTTVAADVPLLQPGSVLQLG
jgi:broad specificity phosphatase PhoE